LAVRKKDLRLVLMIRINDVTFVCCKTKHIIITVNESGNVKNITVSRFRSVILFLVELPILITDLVPAI